MHARLVAGALVLVAPAFAWGQPARAVVPVSPSPDPAATTADLDAQLAAYLAAHGDEVTEVIVVDDVAAPVVSPTTSVRVVSARDLALTPHKNADDLLRVVPGLYQSQHGSEGKGQQYFLRGFDAIHGADLAIRVGGVLLNEQSNVHGQGYADLGVVIPEVVTGVVARKGPFELGDGWFATAGAIDLTLGAEERGHRVGYTLGSTNRHQVVALTAPHDGPTAELAAVEVMRDDGFGQGRSAARATAVAQTELRSGAVILRPLVLGHAARFGEPGVIPLDDLERGTFDRGSAPSGELGGAARRLLAGLALQWGEGRDRVDGGAWLGWRGLELTENFTGYLTNPELGDARYQRHTATSGGARVAWQRAVGARVRVVAGLELAHEALTQLEDRVDADGTPWRAERALDATITSVGGWLGGEVRRGHVTAVGGAHVAAQQVDARDRLTPEASDRGAVGAVAPRLTVAWRRDGLQLAAAAGRGLRPPEARAFTRRPSREGEDTSTYDGGDAAITAADAVELGGQWRNAHLALAATGFATWIERESLFDHVSGVNALRDGSRRLGVEVAIEAAPWPGLRLRGDVTAVDARYVVTDNPVPGAPRLLASGELRWEHGPWSAGVAGRFLGPRPLSHGATAAASAVVDGLAGWRRGRWQVALQLDNLTATDWNEGEYHFASRWDRAQPASALPRVHISPGRPFGVRLGAALTL
jgi:iron complex outermembrane receptor protein